eukprot:7914812-Karenia_brevis.AAC.1
MIEVQWTTILKAIIYVMADDSFEDMYEYAKAKPARRKAWNEAKKDQDEQYAAEHAANMKAAQQAWLASGSSPST